MLSSAGEDSPALGLRSSLSNAKKYDCVDNCDDEMDADFLVLHGEYLLEHKQDHKLTISNRYYLYFVLNMVIFNFNFRILGSIK